MGHKRNRFSSCCGEHFTSLEWPRICPGCGNKFWENSIPVVVVLQPVRTPQGIGLVVITRGEAVGHPGKALPGGFIEIENWRSAAGRECKEEGVRDTNVMKEHSLLLSNLERFTPFFYESVSGGKEILLFALADLIDEENLPPFVPTTETLDREVVVGEIDLVFPLHQKAMRIFFERIDHEGESFMIST